MTGSRKEATTAGTTAARAAPRTVSTAMASGYCQPGQVPARVAVSALPATAPKAAPGTADHIAWPTTTSTSWPRAAPSARRRPKSRRRACRVARHPMTRNELRRFVTLSLPTPRDSPPGACPRWQHHLDLGVVGGQPGNTRPARRCPGPPGGSGPAPPPRFPPPRPPPCPAAARGTCPTPPDNLVVVAQQQPDRTSSNIGQLSHDEHPPGPRYPPARTGRPAPLPGPASTPAPGASRRQQRPRCARRRRGR